MLTLCVYSAGGCLLLLTTSCIVARSTVFACGAGVLGPGQEAGAAQAFPSCELAHLLLKVRQDAGAVL